MHNETLTPSNETEGPLSRALVVLPAPEREAARSPDAGARASAPFLAQLIAARGRLPDQRARRVLAPEEASARYGRPEPARRARLVCAV